MAVWAFSPHRTHFNERKVYTASALSCAPTGRTVGEYNNTSRPGVYNYQKRLRARVRDRQREINPINLIYGPMRSISSMRCFVGPLCRRYYRNVSSLSSHFPCFICIESLQCHSYVVASGCVA